MNSRKQKRAVYKKLAWAVEYPAVGAPLGRTQDKKFKVALEQMPKAAKQTVFEVRRKKDDVLISIVESREGADEMVAKAKASKKASLYVTPVTK